LDKICSLEKKVFYSLKNKGLFRSHGEGEEHAWEKLHRSIDNYLEIRIKS